MRLVTPDGEEIYAGTLDGAPRAGDVVDLPRRDGVVSTFVVRSVKWLRESSGFGHILTAVVDLEEPSQ